ncbi:hypothetical protein V6N13_010957 [Hibiscus sabdariffa]
MKDKGKKRGRIKGKSSFGQALLIRGLRDVGLGKLEIKFSAGPAVRVENLICHSLLSLRDFTLLSLSALVLVPELVSSVGSVKSLSREGGQPCLCP